jgi:hypothetical protein
MLFYRAVDADGKLKLASTQEEARKINKDFDSWEFPTAKAEIREVLQDLIDRAQGTVPAPAPQKALSEPEIGPEDEFKPGPSVCPKCSFDQRRAERNVQAQIDSIASDKLADRIHSLSGWPLGQAAIAVSSRFAELARLAEGEPR